MSPNKHVGAFLLFLLSVIVLNACSKGYDQQTGKYVDKGISVNFPSGWAKTTAVPFATMTLENADKSAHMSLFIQKVPDTMTFDEFLKRIAANQSGFGAQETKSGSVKMGGLEGQWFVRTLTVGGISFTTITYSVMRDATVYSIMGISRADAFGQLEPAFDAVAKSLQYN